MFTLKFQENFIDINNFSLEEEQDRGKKLKRKAKSERIEQKASQKDPEMERKEPRTRRSPLTCFELPAGFTVIKRETKKSNWKEYLGPDGIY